MIKIMTKHAWLVLLVVSMSIGFSSCNTSNTPGPRGDKSGFLFFGNNSENNTRNPAGRTGGEKPLDVPCPDPNKQRQSVDQ